MAVNHNPTPIDGYATATSTLQFTTENIINAHRPSSASEQITLHRKSHFDFLLRNLRQGFPERYISQDASQPWLIYWTLHAFSLFGVGLDDNTKKRTIQTLLALQHTDGGFCGGPGQAPHLLPTYASICAFSIVGRPGEGAGWDQINRKNIYNFFMSLKQPDGSFLVSQHGEVDVRGIYCLLTVATLLNILTPELLAGLPEFLATCQTYEGGFCNASFPGWAFGSDDPQSVRTTGNPPDPTAPRPALGEAHGGYTFCATASWLLLQPYIKLYYPSPSEPRIDTRGLLRWCVQMQGLPIELGGFKGRTNKLVDGCYSWWVGGCVALVETLLGVPTHHDPPADEPHEDESPEADNQKAWDDADESLFNRPALQEYVLCAGQYPAGGLRDKPPKPADAYHTLYCVAGLSAAQHRVTPSDTREKLVAAAWNAGRARAEDKTPSNPSSDAERERVEELRRRTFTHVLSWSEEEGTEVYVGGAANRVNATHPLFCLTVTHSDGMMAHFYGQQPPLRTARAKK